ncbi:MAG: GNAT family N-acetyltransferase [Magnetococcales bacterium]|nr:GNAT family N-acetyltransferase [Magnetococcales bacterium]
MSIENLDALLKPESVAVIGASTRPGSIGALVCRNLLQGGFSGPIMPVNPKYRAVAGVLAYPDVAHLPIIPDLAVLCTPANVIPELIAALIQRGTRAAIIMSSGLKRERHTDGRTLLEVVCEQAHAVGMRLMGPNSLGMLVSGLGLNASFFHVPGRPGRIAFVSQSGAMCTAVLDWACSKGIGFSHFISLGDMADVDFGDMIDYLGMERDVQAILLYIESIHQRRNFMSAARATARNKPILVIKSGQEPVEIPSDHLPASPLVESDAVYAAAISRAGMLRVYDTHELFAAVETLARARPLDGERLCIIANGVGIGVMAEDSLIRMEGRMASLSATSIAALDRVLPNTWSRTNPVDINRDASGSRYSNVIEILASAREIDAILVLHAPTATADSTEAARAVIDAARNTTTNILTAWLGEGAVAEARGLFHLAGIPTYDSPELAVTAFMHMVRYRRNQEMLIETPNAILQDFSPATATAKLIIENTLASGHTVLNEAEVLAVLSAYGIPTVVTHIAQNPEEAETMALHMRFPIALKILSPDLSHKSDVGGVDLFLNSPKMVLSAARKMLRTIAGKKPEARIHGFTLQEMVVSPGAHELRIGVETDPVFGPVLLFGQGGTIADVLADTAVALPPLNVTLARELISRTQVSRLLNGYRDRKPIDMETLCATLLKVSQMIVDLPQLARLNIDPLFADDKGVIAVGARMTVFRPCDIADESTRLAISPYPNDLEEHWRMPDGRDILLRPIRPEDEPEHHEFIGRLTEEDIQFRFLSVRKFLPHPEMARLTQIDYNREMAFIASAVNPQTAKRETLGANRIFTDPTRNSCEFAIVIRSDLKGQGLGRKMMEKMIDYCRSRKIHSMVGWVSPDNGRMVRFVESFGFSLRLLQSEGLLQATRIIEDLSGEAFKEG